MEIRILGSLQVLADDRQIALGAAQQREVLAILLVHRGEVVSVGRIVDELWGERPPDRATKTVQVYVSRLRKALGDGVLVTRGGGYALDLNGEFVDAERFSRLADEGRKALDDDQPKGARCADSRARPVARAGAGGLRLRALCAERGSSAGGVAPRRAREPRRGRPGPRPSR